MDTVQSDCSIVYHKSDFAGSYRITSDTKRLEVTFKKLSLTVYSWCFTYLKVAEVTVICFHELSFIRLL